MDGFQLTKKELLWGRGIGTITTPHTSRTQITTNLHPAKSDWKYGFNKKGDLLVVFFVFIKSAQDALLHRSTTSQYHFSDENPKSQTRIEDSASFAAATRVAMYASVKINWF
ncbi:hypothetical protein [Geobacter anodireducens]